MPGASEVMAAQQPSRVDENAILFAAVDSIIPNPRQPRRIFREDDPKLLELSASIKEHGLLQPIIVTRLDTLEALSGKKASADDPWLTEDIPQSDPEVQGRDRFIESAPAGRDRFIESERHVVQF